MIIFRVVTKLCSCTSGQNVFHLQIQIVQLICDNYEVDRYNRSDHSTGETVWPKITFLCLVFSQWSHQTESDLLNIVQWGF